MAARAPRHLWVSVSADLCEDAKRDLRDIGADESMIAVKNITKLDYGKLDGAKIKFTEGVLFSTYSALVSASRQGSRLEQIVQWLGGAPGADGCVLFDESHKAKNLVSEAEAGGNGKGPPKKKSSKMAKTVEALQDIQQLPARARRLLLGDRRVVAREHGVHDAARAVGPRHRV